MTRHRSSHPSIPHPLRRQRAVESLVVVVGIALLSVGAWWSIQPPTPRAMPNDFSPVDHTLLAEDVLAQPVDDVDPTAFDVALWNPPPPPPAPPKPEQPRRVVAERVPPLTVQLLAIVRRQSDGVLAAMLYDPASDSLFTLGPGESIMGHTVQSVDGDAVHFSAASTETRLSLMPEDRR